MVASRTRTPYAEPLPLFDPAAGEQPPYDSVELYFEAPASVGLFHLDSVLDSRADRVAAIEAAREAGMAAALQCLHENALVKIGYHARQRTSPVTVGVYGRAQLHLTRVAHLLAGEHTDLPRLHDHIYLGEYGIAEEDGQHWPVDLYSVKKAITSMRPRYRVALERSLSASLGVVWNLPEQRGAQRQLIEPPLADYALQFPRVICRDGAQISQRWNVEDITHPPKFDPDAS